MGLSRQEYWSGVPLPSPENGLVETILILCPSQIDFKISATRKVTKRKWRGDIIKKNAIANIQMAFRIRNDESDWQSSQGRRLIKRECHALLHQKQRSEKEQPLYLSFH